MAYGRFSEGFLPLRLVPGVHGSERNMLLAVWRLMLEKTRAHSEGHGAVVLAAVATARQKIVLTQGSY